MKTFLVLMLTVTAAHAQVFCTYEHQACNERGDHFVCFTPWSDRTFCSANDQGRRPPSLKKTIRCQTKMTFIGNRTLTANYPEGEYQFALYDTMGGEISVTEGNFQVTGEYAGHIFADLTGGTLEMKPGTGYLSRLDLNGQIHKMDCKIE